MVSATGPEVIKLFSCSTELSMKFHLVIKIKIPTIKTCFMLNSAEHSCSAELSMKEVLNIVNIFRFVSKITFMLS